MSDVTGSLHSARAGVAGEVEIRARDQMFQFQMFMHTTSIMTPDECVARLEGFTGGRPAAVGSAATSNTAPTIRPTATVANSFTVSGPWILLGPLRSLAATTPNGVTLTVGEGCELIKAHLLSELRRGARLRQEL